MENGAISDGEISASSKQGIEYHARFGRVNWTANHGSWSAEKNDLSQWLQIDLIRQYTRVTRVATQGRPSYRQWVTKYRLQYSNDTVTFQYYREQGQNTTKARTKKFRKQLTSLLSKSSLAKSYSFICTHVYILSNFCVVQNYFQLKENTKY